MRPVNKPCLKPVFLSAWIATTLLVLGLPSTDFVLVAGPTTHYRARDLVRPFLFEEDVLQASSNPGYRVRVPGFTMMLNRDEIVWVERAPVELPGQTVQKSNPDSSRIRMELVNGTPGVTPRGEGGFSGRTTYIGAGPSAGSRPRTTRSVRSVRYPNVYPGIDLRFHGDRQQLEFDFVVAPLADASRIQMRFTGADSLELGPRGELVLRLGSSVIRQHSPRIYQLVDGRQKRVQGRFQLGPGDRVSIEVDPSYDRSCELIIDPVLEFSTYWGGSAGDVPAAVAVDGDGNLYVAGSTGSTDFPLKNPAQEEFAGGGTPNGDLFVTKLDPSGSSVIYSTYIGGSGTDIARGIAVDADGQVFLTGTTFSGDFPATNGSYQTDCSGQCPFVVKLGSDGSQLVYSTFVGRGDGAAVAVDSDGSAVITGRTSSSDFPVKSAFQSNRAGGWDGFVSKLNPDGSSLIFSTYLGGGGDDNLSGQQDVALDPSGNIYVVGRTPSTDFPVLKAVQPGLQGEEDAYVAKFSGQGTLIHSSYLGGAAADGGQAVFADAAGNAFVAGNTLSSDFPTVSPLQAAYGGGTAIGDAFVAKIAPQGETLEFSTFLGGTGGDTAGDVALDSLGRVVVAGNASADFPVREPFRAFEGLKNYVAKISPDGSELVYSTPIGGADADISIATYGTRVFAAGNLSAGTLPVLNALQPQLKGSTDGFLVEISDAGTLYFAQFGNGGSGASNVVSEILLTNSSEATPSQATVTLRRDDGSPFPLNLSVTGDPGTAEQQSGVSELEVTVAPLGAVRIATDGLGELQTGSVAVVFDNPLGGVIRFNLTPFGTAGVGSSQLVRGFITPVRRQAINTGIAVANPLGEQIGVTMRLRGLNGQQVQGGLRTLALAAGEHLAKFLDELFPNADLSNFEGTVTVTTGSLNGLMIATALELGTAAGEFTTLPVTPIP